MTKITALPSSLERAAQNVLQHLSQGGHVMIHAPTGFRKTPLLEQLAAQGLPLLDAEHGLRLPADNVVLIDNARVLSDDQMRDLLKNNRQQLVIATRHARYSSVPTLFTQLRLYLLNHTSLHFNPQELESMSLSPQLYGPTSGWPALCGVLANPLLDPSAYFADLLSRVPEHLHGTLNLLLRHADPSKFTTPQKNELRDLMNTGLPIITLNSKVSFVPLFEQFLLETLLPQGPEHRHDETLEYLLSDLSPTDARLESTLQYFQHNDDDQHAYQKVQLLEQFQLAELPPILRDHLGYYLRAVGRNDDAERVLMQQHQWQEGTTRTYTLLARACGHTNDLNRFRQYLELAYKHIKTEDDRARWLIAEAELRHTENDYAKAQKLSLEAYGAATHTGNSELMILALRIYAHAAQLGGDHTGALKWATEALRLSENQGPRYLIQNAALHTQLAEIAKDLGHYEMALNHVHSGLQLQREGPMSSVPYLYTTRGLIYLETGNHDLAQEAFEHSVRAFQQSRSPLGRLVPHTFLTYLAYRMDDETEMKRHASEVRQIALTYQNNDIGAYQPFTHALLLISQGRPLEALDALRTVDDTGTLTYDSVLITHLLLGQLSVQHSIYTAQDLQQLILVLNARPHTPQLSDPTASAYARDFRDFYAHAATLGIDDDRFLRLTQSNIEARELIQPQIKLHLHTLGTVQLMYGIHPVSTDNAGRGPLLLLSYLSHHMEKWISRHDLTTQLFSGKLGAFSTASSKLKSMLSNEIGHEKFYVQARINHDTANSHMLVSLPNVIITSDLDDYLQHYHPGHDPQRLEQMLKDIKPYFPSNPSDYATEINDELQERTVQVALSLCEHHLEQPDPDRVFRAAEMLLRGLAFVPDPQLTQRYNELITQLPSQLQTPLPDDDHPNFTLSVQNRAHDLHSAQEKNAASGED